MSKNEIVDYIGGSENNDIIKHGNNTYEWNFSKGYVPLPETIKFFLWEKEFFTNENKTPAFHFFIIDNLFRKGFRHKSFESYRGSAKSVLLNVKFILYLAYTGVMPNYGRVYSGILASASILLVKSHINRLILTLEGNKKLSAVLQIKKKRLDDYPMVSIDNISKGTNFILDGKSPTQKVRGQVAGITRYDFVMLDDVESEESVATPESIHRMVVWYTETVFPSVKKGKNGGWSIMIGTPLAEKSLLTRARLADNTTTVIVKACKNFIPTVIPKPEGCAWADMYDGNSIMEDYLFFKANNNTLGFWQEIMMQLKNDDSLLFDTSKLQWYDMVDAPTDIEIFISLDASTGTLEGDDSSFSVTGVTSNGSWYILELVNGKFNTIQLLDKIFELCKFYGGNLVIEEGTIFRMLEPLIESRSIETGYVFEIFTVKRNTIKATGRSGKGNGKHNVFKMFSPRVNSGRLMLPSNPEFKESVGELIRQMEGVTLKRILVDKDDVLDSIAQLELLDEVVQLVEVNKDIDENNDDNDNVFVNPYH